MHPIRISIRASLATLVVAGGASAQTVFVNTADDTTDFGGAQQVADLPGPDGKVSLAEAALASNNTPGVQTIGFHVPPVEWTYQWLYPGRAVLNPFLGLTLTDTVILDGTTQSAFTGETNPDGGSEVVLWSSIYLNNTVGSLVRGFDHTVIYVTDGSSNVIQGNTVSGIELSGSNNALIGGTNPGEGNTGGTIKLVSSSNNVVIGNTPQRVRVLGNGPFQPPTLNNRIGGPTLAERNHITGYGSITSDGFPGGMAVEIFQADGTIVENNWIGTTPDGLAQGHPYTTVGIKLWDDNHGTVVRGNRIAGVRALAVPHSGPSYYVGVGIEINGSGNGVAIVGNTIGLDANDQPVLGSVQGIVTVNDPSGPVTGVTIGGTAPGEGNVIAGQDRKGILVSNAYSGVRIRGNSIHQNGDLGIDLVDAAFQQGVTANDALDVDAGANGLQNHPVLLSAIGGGAALDVAGTLNSTPSASFAVDFFATAQCDPSGFGEGRVLLGSTTVATNALGNAAFAVTLPVTVPAGWFVSATATNDASGSTSEFSACLVVEPAFPPTGSSYCFGDGSGSACPCGNSGAIGNGCAHSLGANGANLAGTGTASLASDSFVLLGSGMPNSSALYFQGTQQQNGGLGNPFGDGLRCAGGAVIRLGTRSNASGASRYPDAGDAPISVRGAVLAPGTRYYQVWYRNAAAFCTASTFNLTNGWLVAWTF